MYVIKIKMFYSIMYDIIIYIFFLSLFSCIFSTNYYCNKTSLHIALFFTIKFFLNYTNCTLGYIECKIRNTSRENGYINNLCYHYNNFINTDNGHIIFILLNLFILIQFCKIFIN